MENFANGRDEGKAEDTSLTTLLLLLHHSLLILPLHLASPSFQPSSCVNRGLLSSPLPSLAPFPSAAEVANYEGEKKFR